MHDLDKLNVLTIGAGAIGTYIGGSLALAGNRVVFVEQPQAVEELTRTGLALDLSVDRGQWLGNDPASAIHHPSAVEFVSGLDDALKRGPFDIAILALKSFDTPVVLDGMRSFVEQLPPILCLSNGVDNESAISAVVGIDKVIAGTVTSSVGRRGVGDIILERLRGVGLVDRHPLSLFLAEAFNQAGLNAHLFHSAADMKWSKMLTNLPANATSAILNMTAKEVFAHPGLFRLEMRMLRETLSVMRANRLHVIDLPRVPVRALALGTSLPGLIAHPLMLKAVGGGRGGKMPSFHIDLHSGRGRSEVDWLNGAVVRYGEKAGVPTPINKLLTNTLLALTHAEIPLTRFNHQAEQLLSLI
jgi:2-dehydropantoate 2-reductase